MRYKKLLEEIQTLPSEEQKALADEILKRLEKANVGKPRILGMHAGSTVYVADDFDAELPDSFWG